MRIRTLAVLSVILAIAVSLWAGALAAQESEVSQSLQDTTEFYGPPISPAIYLVNFLLLYMVNPRVAANMPAYKAPIPKAVVARLEQNPSGCPYAAFEHLFGEQTSGHPRLLPNKCFWPVECQLERKFVRLAPHRARRSKQDQQTIRNGAGCAASSSSGHGRKYDPDRETIPLSDWNAWQQNSRPTNVLQVH
jgi:hypothetical protein